MRNDSMARSLFTLVLPLLLATSVFGCKTKTAAQAPSPAAIVGEPPAPPPEPPINPEGVLFVFQGKDAHAMAGLGHDLETKRPPMGLDLLQKMLATLRKDPGDDEQVRKMRPLLFRTTAVLIGRPALPLLSDCVATVPALSQLCGGALIEIQK
jgi:hypothetical protein